MSGKIEASEHRIGMLGVLGVKRSELMQYLKLGAGSVAAITLTDLALSRVLVRNGQPIIPEAWSPLAIAGLSVVAGQMTGKRLDKDLGLGMIAGGVGVAVSALVAKFTSPAAAATATTAAAAEAAGAGAQQTSGFGLGRAYAPGLQGFAGLGSTHALASTNPSLYGVGTPDMSAANMFNGATVSIEDEGGPMAGAAVEFEDNQSFAGALN